MVLKRQKGQILLVVILIVIVALTVGLSLASRSITSLKSSTEEAESQKALAAAEAGIERAMQGSIPIAVQGNNTSNNSSYATTVVQVQSSSFLLNGWSTVLDAAGRVIDTIPNTVPKDEGADVWFVGHDTNGNPDYSAIVNFNNFLHLYWGSPSEVCGTPSAPAAIQAIVITRNRTTGAINSYRYAYDSCSRENNFAAADKGSFTVPEITGVTFGNRTPEGGANNDLAKGVNDIVMMRVVPIYKDSVIGIYACNRAGAGSSCTALPSQGYVITSTGTSGQTSHKIATFKGYQQTYLPYLAYGLFVANDF